MLVDTRSRQSIPLENYVANLREIISLVPSSIPVLVIVSLQTLTFRSPTNSSSELTPLHSLVPNQTPPIIQATRWARERNLSTEDRSEANTARYAQACRDLVAEVGGKARLVDLWKVSSLSRRNVLPCIPSADQPLLFLPSTKKAMETYRANPSNNLDDLLLDGLHLTPEVRPSSLPIHPPTRPSSELNLPLIVCFGQGYKLLNTLVLPIMDELKLSPDDLEKVYPDWSNAIPEDTPSAAGEV